MPIDEIVGEAIDRAVSIEMRFGSGLPRGVTQPLFDAARSEAGGPMCLRAAAALKAHVGRGDYVLILTGAGAPPTLPKGETDGPPGAAALAHAVEVGLGAKPILISEERNLASVIASAEGIGLAVVDEATFRARGGVALALTLPLGPTAGAAFADDVFARFPVKAVMFVEKLGPNSQGVCYTINGTARPSGVMGHAHLLAALAQERGVVSIGIGDGGNEIGCGRIHATVQDVQPRGRVAQVEGDGGIATVTGCDHLVFAACPTGEPTAWQARLPA